MLVKIVLLPFVVMAVMGPLDAEPRNLPLRKKVAAVQPLVDDAARCIVSAALRDSRHKKAVAELGIRRPKVGKMLACLIPVEFGEARSTAVDAGTFGDVVVDSVIACETKIDAARDACDEYFEDGVGARFLNGPFMREMTYRIIDAAEKSEEASAQ